jgi:hypothetical protein
LPGLLLAFVGFLDPLAEIASGSFGRRRRYLLGR